MKRLASEKIMKRVIAYEGIAFGILIAVAWLNEYFHFPSMIWGAEPKGFQWEEALLETSFMLLAAAFVIAVTRRLMRRLDQLEGILPICSSCKDIRDERGHWHKVEEYVHNHTKADFSHGLCPECARAYAEEADIAFDTQIALRT